MRRRGQELEAAAQAQLMSGDQAFAHEGGRCGVEELHRHLARFGNEANITRTRGLLLPLVLLLLLVVLL
jgi:hypothetical protein